MNPPQTKRWRILRRSLIGLAICVTLIGLFYTEENWRGNRAWESCKRALVAQGVKLDWADYIPAPVPENENVFGVPEMQKAFVGRGATELSKNLSYPGFGAAKTARLIVAELNIGLPGADTTSHAGATVLQWGNPQARMEADRLIKDALGPAVMDPVGYTFILRSPKEIRPPRLLLECQTAPTTNELLQFLPRPIANTMFPDYEKIQVEAVAEGSYKVTMLAPDTVAELLAWSEQHEPDFALIRSALQRPYTRMNGDYSSPAEVPIPNFVTVRITAQRLAAMAQCHLVEGKPEEALRDLTLIHNLCRILEGSHPMTLLAAMINVAVTGLYADTIADGMRRQGWREPQLAALQKQLKQIDLLPPMKQAFELGRIGLCDMLETMRPARVLELFFHAPPKANSWTEREDLAQAVLMPRGWVCQNMVTGVNLFPNAIDSLDPASQIVFPGKAKAFDEEVDAIHSHGLTPYTALAVGMVPNATKAIQTTARNQTMVNQTLVVCALERYHLAHGEYPESLTAIVPQYISEIPHDVIGGQPPHYRRAADGTFILYSVGWSGRDSGGVRGKSNTHGDWVWPALD